MEKEPQVLLTPDTLLDKFWNLYETASPEAAVDFIFGTNVWMTDQASSVEDVKLKLRTLIRMIGAYYGYEKLLQKGVVDRYELRSYFVRYDRQPIRFTFIFYRSGSEWVLQNFNFDSSMDEELKESAKLVGGIF